MLCEMRRLFLIAAALAACVCWMVAWPSRQAGLPRQRAAPRRARGLKGAAGLPRTSLVRANRTTWRLPSGQCVQRAIVLPTMTCSLPHCNHTVDDDKLMVLTNQHVRKWVGYLRFNLGYLQMPAGARLVDAELRLFGTPQCRGGGRDGNNFTHQLHLLRPRQEATTIDINKPYPKRLCGQWAQQALWGRKFRVPINLNGRQLLTASRHKTLVFALSEKQFGGAALHAPKTLRRACGYLSSAHHEPDKWPRLALTYAWPCCDDGRVGTDGDDGADGTRRAPERESGGGGGRRGRAAAAAAEAIQAAGREGEAGGGGVSFQRPPWIKMMDWQKLRADQRVHGAWHTRLAASPPPWALHSRTDASAVACEPPSSRAHARGGQRRPPAGEAPALSVIVAYHNNENMTAACMEALFACADEAPRLAQTHHALDAPLLTVPGTAQVASAEYLFVDDGSEVRTGALPALLERLSRRFGIRYELSRYPVSVGFTLAVTEAARRANGTFLLFLNNDAFVRRDALRALLETFSSHADVGVVGAKLVGANRTMQEAGAIVWSGASGAWFLKSSRLREGRADEENHRLAYVRETDYVSAACAMVRRPTPRAVVYPSTPPPCHACAVGAAADLRAAGHVRLSLLARLLRRHRPRLHNARPRAPRALPAVRTRFPRVSHDVRWFDGRADRTEPPALHIQMVSAASPPYAAVRGGGRVPAAAQDHVHAHRGNTHVPLPRAVDRPGAAGARPRFGLDSLAHDDQAAARDALPRLDRHGEALRERRARAVHQAAAVARRARDPLLQDDGGIHAAGAVRLPLRSAARHLRRGSRHAVPAVPQYTARLRHSRPALPARARAPAVHPRACRRHGPSPGCLWVRRALGRASERFSRERAA